MSNSNHEFKAENSIVLTDPQQRIFREFIQSLIHDTQYRNILIPHELWQAITNNAEHKVQLADKFWLSHGNFTSNFTNLSKIPMDPALTDQIEKFFLLYPDTLKSAYLEPTEINTDDDPKHYLRYDILTRLKDYFYNWALEDKSRAKMIVDQTKLYQVSREAIENEQSTSDAKVYKYTSIYFLVAAIVFTALAITLTVAWLGGAIAFLALSAGSSYLSHYENQKAKQTPLKDFANSASSTLSMNAALRPTLRVDNDATVKTQPDSKLQSVSSSAKNHSTASSSPEQVKPPQQKR